MSRRRALLMSRRRQKVTLTRTSNTTYLVDSTTASAILKFKRLSDGYVQNVGNVTLPYTFTHTAGEVWEVDGGNGYVSAWGIDTGSTGYLQAANNTDLQLNDFMEISFYYDNTVVADIKQVFGKYIYKVNDNRWNVSIQDNKIGFYSRTSSSLHISERNLSIVEGWRSYKMEINGTDLKQTLDGVVSNVVVDTNSISRNNTFPFKIAQGAPGGTSPTQMVGIFQNYKHGTEVFSMQEGTGTTTTGSEGTVLNLEGGATWIKL